MNKSVCLTSVCVSYAFALALSFLFVHLVVLVCFLMKERKGGDLVGKEVGIMWEELGEGEL